MRFVRHSLFLILGMVLSVWGEEELQTPQGPYALARSARTPKDAALVLSRLSRLPTYVVYPLVRNVKIWPKDNLQKLTANTIKPIPPDLAILLAEGYGKVQVNELEKVSIKPEPFTLTELLDWAKAFEPRTDEVKQAWLALKPVEDIPMTTFEAKWKTLKFETKKASKTDEDEKEYWHP